MKDRLIHPRSTSVNSEIFARALFSRNFALAKFRENKILTHWQSHYAVYWYKKNTPLTRIFNVANMCFNAIRVNKILAKISEFTACYNVYQDQDQLYFGNWLWCYRQFQWTIRFDDEDVFCKFWWRRRLRHVFQTFISKIDVCRTS